MKRALVIAITRLGDLIQIEPMLRALKAAGRAEHITLLVERSFVEIASELPSADDLQVVDFAKILGTLNGSSGVLPVADYMALSHAIVREKHATLVNVTHTRPSMVLAALAGEDSIGVTLDRDGHQVVNNSWLQYFFATNLARPWCSFNLVDIYVNAITPQTKFADRKPQLLDSAPGQRAVRRDWQGLKVLLHAGASQSDKQWPEQSFVQLAKALLDRGTSIALIGARRLESNHPFPTHARLQDLTGRTSVRDVIELCRQADVMVSADSGPVHIAAATRLPLVVIEGGSAHAFETAPYDLNALVLQPHLSDVTKRIPSKSVTSAPAEVVPVTAVLAALELRMFGEPIALPTREYTIYETREDRNVPGLMLAPVVGTHRAYESWQRRLRRFWSQAIGGEASLNASVEGEIARLFSDCAQQAHRVSRAVSSVATLQARANALSAAERKLQERLLRQPALHHVAQFLQIARSSVQGDVARQADALAALYSACSMAADALDKANSEMINMTYRNTPSLEGVA